MHHIPVSTTDRATLAVLHRYAIKTSNWRACPECGRDQYYYCGGGGGDRHQRRMCSCWTAIPEGELPQMYLGHDLVGCPWCGFVAHMDFWAEREMEWASANDWFGL